MPHPRTLATASARRRPATVAAAAALALAATGVVGPAAAQQTGPADPPPPTATSGPTGASGPEGAPESSGRELRLTRGQTRRLQRKVRVRADGAFGRSTRRALLRWERRAGLEADGRADPTVLRRMRIALTDAQEREADGPAPQEASAPGEGGAARRAVAAAKAQEGTPYSSGGAQPGGFDCSGLTSWAFDQAGISIPRTSFDQYEVGTAVERADIQAGDLVFFDSAGAGASDVGIATSPTRVVSATTHGVMEHATFDAYWGSHYVGARRVPGS